MKRIKLKWGIIPAEAYIHLQKFTGNESYYYPALGNGVYMFVHSNGKRYQVYYVGETQEIGKRLWEHVDAYTGGDPRYWLSVEASLFKGNIVELFNRNSGDDFKQQSKDFTKEKRYEVGTKILKNTYFVFALTSKDDRKDIESLLQLGVLRKNGFKCLGWIGEKNTTAPEKDLTIINEFLTPCVRKIMETSIPQKIKVTNGNIQLNCEH